MMIALDPTCEFKGQYLPEKNGEGFCRQKGKDSEIQVQTQIKPIKWCFEHLSMQFVTKMLFKGCTKTHCISFYRSCVRLVHYI